MKKALVLSLLILGLGLAASAQFSGSWATTLTFDPVISTAEQWNTIYWNDSFFSGLDSTLSLKYVLSSWTFSATSAFDLYGFASQKFSVSGSLGAFSLSTNMSFDPAAISEKVYYWPEDTDDWDTDTDKEEGAPACPIRWAVGETAPIFLKWDVTADVSIAGVEVGVYVLQDQSNYDVALVDYLFQNTGIDDNFVQTDSVSCTSYENGIGWRLKVAGSFGGVKVTSYTYFNLNEWTNAYYTGYFTYEPTCGLIGKSGYFKIPYEGCDLPFYEEFLMLEGFMFGCATIDAAISIDCDGFAYATFLASDVSLGGWASLDFAITFTTDSKSFESCISLDALAFDCIVVELGFGADGYGVITDNVIDSIYVHGISFSTTWGGVTFSSKTEFDAYSLLMSDTDDYSYLDSKDTWTWLLPYTGKGQYGLCNYWEIADAVYEVQCTPVEHYKLWEQFTVDVDADACCGGLFDLTVSTYFGDYESLDWIGYVFVHEDATAFTAVLTNPFVGAGDLNDATQDKAEADEYAAYYTGLYCDPVAGSTRDRVYGISGYGRYEDDVATLFDWAKTSVKLGVGVGSNVTLNFGFGITAFGWDEISVGFKWSF